jgi:uncharacterized protein YegP (UPF0339 family)
MASVVVRKNHKTRVRLKAENRAEIQSSEGYDTRDSVQGGAIFRKTQERRRGEIQVLLEN